MGAMESPYSPRARNLAIAAALLLVPGFALVALFTGVDETVARNGFTYVTMAFLVQVAVSIAGLVIAAKGVSRRANTSGPIIASVLALLAGIGSCGVGILWIILTATA